MSLLKELVNQNNLGSINIPLLTELTLTRGSSILISTLFIAHLRQIAQRRPQIQFIQKRVVAPALF